MTNVSILIIDARPSLTTTRVGLEQRYDVDVIHAQNARKGLELVRNSSPEYILLNPNGIETESATFLSQLAQMGKNTPVIVVGDDRAVNHLRSIYPHVVGRVSPMYKDDDLMPFLQRQRPMRTGKLLKRSVQEMMTLHQVGKSVASLTDLDTSLDRIVEAAVYLLRAEEGSIMLVDPETNELYLRAEKGLDEKQARGFNLKIEETLIGSVVRTGQPVKMACGVSDDARLKIVTGYLVNALLYVPLTLRGQIIGVLGVANRTTTRVFTEHDQRLLEALADYAALAVEVARQHRTLQRLLETLTDYAALAVEMASQHKALRRLRRDLAVSHAIAANIEELRGQLITDDPKSLSALRHIEGATRILTRLAETEEDSSQTVFSEESFAVAQIEGHRQDAPLIVDQEYRLLTGILKNIPAEFVGVSVELPDTDVVEIDIIVRTTGMEVLPHWAQKMRFFRGRDSGLLEFTLIPREVGPKQILVEFYYQRHWLANIQFEVEVVEAPDLITASDYIENKQSDAFSTLARQIDTALQNANLFEEVQKISERSREIDRPNSEFLVSIGHELKTPLNSILGYAELMLMGVSGELPPDALEDVQAIYDNSQHLLSIINDILDLSKIEAGRLTLNLEEVQVAPLLEEIKRSSASLFINKPVEMIVEVEGDFPSIQADRTRLNQILNNLVLNAVRFIDEGSIDEGNITLRVFRDDRWVCMEVEGTSVGIAEAEQEKISERFGQVDSSSAQRAQGTGLGLTIVRHLMEMHGGTINVRSQLGQGATFSIRLPIED